MSGHTPGPWFTMVDSTKEYIAVYAKVGAGTKVICPVKRGDADDATLIAAAPELLAGCRALLAIYDEHLGGLGLPGVREARAAIAKAEGR